MSDEEKKAIERLIIYKDKIKDELYPIIDFEEEKAIGIILNLLEKQSKEIEELNLENIELKQSKIVDKNSIPNQDNFYDCYNFVSKDKIKAKIEELEKQDRENRMSHNYLVIPVLQSLLEKE